MIGQGVNLGGRLRRNITSFLGGVASALLAFASFQIPAQVVINEVLADNRSSILPNNDVTDYLELFNRGGTPVEIGGWRLTDTVTNTSRFAFPAGVTIPAGGYLLVYCDSVTNSGGFHTGFGLSRDGSFLGLYNAGGTLQDSLTFGLQIPDRAVGRLPNGNGAFTLNVPTPRGPNATALLGNPSRLFINEWMALNVETNLGGLLRTNSDWIELFNDDANPVDLSGLVLVDNSLQPLVAPPIPVLSFISGTGFLRMWADDRTNPINHVNFALSSTSGDSISLFQKDRVTLIDQVVFGPMNANLSMGRLPNGSSNIVTFRYRWDTPADSNLIPLTNGVVINEVLAHTDAPLEDAIELFNPTTAAADISGWWLSNRRERPYKFRIPMGTVLPPGGFKVFYERDFNPDGTGNDPSFRPNSAHGDSLCLFQADSSGLVTGHYGEVRFGASANGVSFGRYVTSEGKSDFVPMSMRSFGRDNPASIQEFRSGTGRTNPYPIVGPLVINELMYHPPDILSGTNHLDDSTNEFIEILNVAPRQVPLFDPNTYSAAGYGQYADGRTNTWRLRGAVDFEFPPGLFLDPMQTVLVANFDPTHPTNAARLVAFRAKYGMTASLKVLGPYRGKLPNANGSVDLLRPDAPQAPDRPDAGFVPYILADHVNYKDTSPWPLAADGAGKSLQRRNGREYGDDPVNWLALAPTAGRLNSLSKPAITNHPRSLTVVAGSAAAFKIKTSGAQPMDYQWFFSGDPLSGETNAYLTIPCAYGTNAGAYRVVVSNFAGVATSTVAILTVDCGLALSHSAISFPAAGGNAWVEVTAGVGCVWSASTQHPWINLHPGPSNIVGGGFIAFTVPTNNSLTRAGSIQVAGRLVSITQFGRDVVPPSVTITLPTNGSITTNFLAAVRGVAADNHEVTHVEYQVNGGPMLPAVRAGSSTRKTWYWSGSVSLQPGSNTVTARSVDIAGNQSLLAVNRCFRSLKWPLGVEIHGPGRVTPFANGSRLDIGRGYSITALPAPGNVLSNWVSGGRVISSSPTMRFIMDTNLVLIPSFVPSPFLALQGTYSGLFCEASQFNPQRSGSFNLTVSGGGTYSGRVTSGLLSAPFSGQFTLDGSATNHVRLGSNALDLVWSLDLSPGRVDRLQGTVRGEAWIAEAVGDRSWFHSVTNRAPMAGRYTFAAVGGTNAIGGSVGHGPGTLVVGGSGAATLTLRLADNTPLTRTGFVTRYGHLSLYSGLYGGKGAILGWLQLPGPVESPALGGHIHWARPALAPAAGGFDPAGFTSSFQVVGSRYVAPMPNTNRVLNFAQGLVVFDGSAQSTGFTNNVTLSTGNIVRNNTQQTPNPLSMAINAGEGTFSGTVRSPRDAGLLSFRGVVLPDFNSGLGFFMGTNQTGCVRFIAGP